jgi:hypothetical protein
VRKVGSDSNNVGALVHDKDRASAETSISIIEGIKVHPGTGYQRILKWQGKEGQLTEPCCRYPSPWPSHYFLPAQYPGGYPTPLDYHHSTSRATPSAGYGISSTIQGLFTCLDMQKSFVPRLRLRPNEANQAPPRRQIVSSTTTFSTFTTVIRHPERPKSAGKGGFNLGLPCLPSTLSNEAISSPQMYAQAAPWRKYTLNLYLL